MLGFGEAVLLVAAAGVGGALNAFAGGGSFLTFPALLFTHIGPIEANATSTVALWPGSAGSAAGYRRELREERLNLLWLGAPSLLGGLLGAILLVRTPASLFARLVPFLLLAATLIFTFGDTLKRRVLGRGGKPVGLWLAALVQIPIAAYGGYFGGGMGLMMLAVWALVGMSDIHRMNALKSILAVLINGVAIVAFVSAGKVDWLRAGLMAAAATGGGYAGAAVARQFSPAKVRRFVVVYGWILTTYFFIKTYAM